MHERTRIMTPKPALAASAAMFTLLALGAPAVAGPDRAGAGTGTGKDNGRHLGHATAPGQTASHPGRGKGAATSARAKARAEQRKAERDGQRDPRPSPPAAAQRGGAAAARSADPAGNNGTVKIAGLGDLDGIPNNTPHPGCAFRVEWYGFDAGDDVVSTVTFAAHAPTATAGLTVQGPTQVPVGGDAASGAGTATGLDAVETYTLSFTGAPHPKQGYHVRLTVATPRSNGNDTKTKMFWVEPCATASAAPSLARASSARSSAQGSTQDASVQEAAVPEASSQRAVLGTFAGTPEATEDAAGSVPVPLVVEAGEKSPLTRWAESPFALVMTCLSLLLMGAAGALRLRRRA